MLSNRSSAESSSGVKLRAGTAHTSPHFLVLDLSLPSHIISDRSLFTTYTSSRKLHRTIFGNDIIIEGYGDVHIHTFAGTKLILFHLRDCWHVPLSPHHFLSCTRVISQGKQVMLTGRTPRMIYSHKDRLVKPQLPKYVPFTQDGGNFVLKFHIPVEMSSIQPTQAVTPLFSLHALSLQPFAGMAALSSNPLNTTEPSDHPHYLVIDTTLPSQVFGDHSLFTTYIPSHRLHQTPFGTTIIIEGIGDVHICVFVDDKPILFHLWDSWHVLSSPHHFLSALSVILLGNQLIIASPSCSHMIFSHKKCIAEPTSSFPKYMPFTQLDGFTVLHFHIPAQVSLPPQSISTAT